MSLDVASTLDLNAPQGYKVCRPLKRYRQNLLLTRTHGLGISLAALQPGTWHQEAQAEAQSSQQPTQQPQLQDEAEALLKQNQQPLGILSTAFSFGVLRHGYIGDMALRGLRIVILVTFGFRQSVRPFIDRST